MDGVSILLDGVCDNYPPYMGTPDKLRKELLEKPADIVGFSHKHPDHYNEDFVKQYKRLNYANIVGAEFEDIIRKGTVSVEAFATRHIGKATVPHTSFIIKGSKESVLFAADASPSALKKGLWGEPKPDVVIVPYVYAVTDFAWRTTKEFGAETIIILHLPERTNDRDGLWDMVYATIKDESSVYLPDVGETIKIDI